MSLDRARIGVVGATGAVGGVLLDILRERGYDDVRLFASARSAGTRARRPRGRGGDAGGARRRGGVDVFFFAIGAAAEPRAGAACRARRRSRPRQVVRLADGAGRPARRARGERRARARARRHHRRPQLLDDPADGRAQAACTTRPGSPACVSRRTSRPRGPVSSAWRSFARRRLQEHDLGMDWDFDGEEFDEETKIREETRKIMELPGPAGQRDVRARAGARRPLGGRVDRDGAAALCRARPRAARSSRRACASRSSRRPGRRRDRTTCSSAASAPTAQARGSRCSSSATTSARAPRSTRSRSRSSCSPKPRSPPRASAPATGFAGAKTSRSRASTDARLPASTGWSPPKSSRTSSTRAGAAQRAEAEIGEEVAREDRAVDEEALVHRLPLAVRVRERLQRRRAAVPRVADRREEQRLHHPRRRRIGEVGARDEHGVVRRRPRRQLGSAREERRGAVLHRAEQMAVAVDVERPPRPPLRLGPLAPAVLLRLRPRPATATTRTRGRPTAPSAASRPSGRRPAVAPMPRSRGRPRPRWTASVPVIRSRYSAIRAGGRARAPGSTRRPRRPREPRSPRRPRR